jgi:tetrahydromethanopterin S-methyltransferase subunit C
VKFDPALSAKYTNSMTVMTTGVSSRWYRKTRRTRRHTGTSSCRCPGGLASGAAVVAGAPASTPARAYAIEDGVASAFFDLEVPSNRFGVRYGVTLSFVTMPSPVSVFVGFISPPDTFHRNNCMIVSKPCR